MPTRKGGPRPTRRVERPLAATASVGNAMQAPAAQREAIGSPRNPRFPLGVDVWPVDSDSAGPSGWYQHDVGGQLGAMADAGVSLVRLYASWRLMEPQVGQYDDGAFGRFARTIAEAGSRGMRCIVVLFSAEPHAQPSTVTWATKRDARTDPYMLERATDFVTRVASSLRSERTFFGWQLADEAFLEG
ncbi:MAG: beta-galactosidase, partial [Coriobacteriales bacterium]|nr:beta-galactosidase [Coriobacteriales bacterium]